MPMIKPAIVSPGAPQQHKQPSRKGKKAWRKNVDVTEIQEGLEEVRDELIKGYELKHPLLNGGAEQAL
jgi:nucleolar protein 53